MCVAVTVQTLEGPLGEDQLTQKAKRLHQSSLVIDTHIDTISHLYWRRPNFAEHLPGGRVDLPRLREGGVGAAFFAIWIDDPLDENAALQHTLRALDAMYETVAANDSELEIVLTAGDIERIHAAGKIGVILSIEGGRAIADDLGVLRMLYRLGIRSITLAWKGATNWIDSWYDQVHGGLTDFGRDVVLEMNRLGMLVDISHVSDKSFYDVLDISERPVFASHSSCRALCNHRRNMTDEMIHALADHGGVININFSSNFVVQGWDDEWTNRHWQRSGDGNVDGWDIVGGPSPNPGPPFERLAEHFRHALGLVGASHVGIGSDYDGVSSVPQEVEDISKLPRITESLLADGHSESEIRSVLGLNNLRLIQDVMG